MGVGELSTHYHLLTECTTTNYLLMELIDLLGWVASFLILLSFLYSGIKLRTINGVGAILWVIWGVLKGEGSVIVLNIMVVVIQAIKIYQLSKETR
jgi:hypothetical protein